MSWDDDALDYGYVVTRLPGGGWWHLHFGRADVEYDCQLLGRSTDVLALVQRFGTGCVRLSPRYLLTLDGEGVPSEIPLNTNWDQLGNGEQNAGDAAHFQTAIMPLLYDSGAMQQALASLVEHGQHHRLIANGKLRPVD